MRMDRFKRGNTMKEPPIVLQDWEVNAVLDGRKTQIRRAVKIQPSETDMKIATLMDSTSRTDRKNIGKHHWVKMDGLEVKKDDGVYFSCPYGSIGNRLWVREAWGIGCRPHPAEGCVDGIEYRADEAYCDEIENLPLYVIDVPDNICLDDLNTQGWKPSVHMPRWASRITLEITGVRVERLNDISDDDVGKEGLEPFGGGDVDNSGNWHRLYFDPRPDNDNVGVFAKEAYKRLWGMLHGKYSWKKNPWVWVLDIKRICHEQ